MIEELKNFKWAHFKGGANWVRCFAHILNLIAQVVMRPFGSHKKKKTTNDLNFEEEEDSDDEDIDGEDADEQIQGFNKEVVDDCSEYEDDDSAADAPMATDLIDEDEIELESADVNNLSDEDDDDRYTSHSCKQSLAKFRAIARKLNKSPHSKEVFVGFCRENKCLKPHNIQRDVKTRWNSTLMQLTSITRCAKAMWGRSQRTRSLFGWLEGYTWTTKDTRSTPLNGGLHKSAVAILMVGCFKWHSTCLAAQPQLSTWRELSVLVGTMCPLPDTDSMLRLSLVA
ncbi:hypothetical protein PSTG_13816 [Puccinia striiformis f. sp. tritici PST-78]|uniref:hAT-like transposase RNase-H fold domain-containing protein n=1 Tax=Puccinia striiformis f. sp. tritici PST-78 TaxID=1165861 RepID=A0A0L0V0F2_9BASI|nr:hypothetical protein PSTG_13816 [Puccinia striiformis f. sp. tritici PST-78]